MAKVSTKKIFVRPAEVRGRPAPIPRQVGLDVTARPGEDWPRHAIAPEGELVERTAYITDLLRRGDLVLGEVPARPRAERAPSKKKEE